MTASLPPNLFDSTTLLSLGATVALLLAADKLSKRVLPGDSSASRRFLFVWHAWDALIHFLFEGAFLYTSFFVSAVVPRDESATASAGAFLDRPERAYGSAYGDGPAERLWQVYARADRRWAHADANVVSIELLTVLGAGPLSVLICVLLARRDPRVAFWMVVLAVAELYGGFMTFCPEWLTGSSNLDTSNFMYLYVYLIFFNGLWVAVPSYILWVAYRDISTALMLRNGTRLVKLSKYGKAE